MHVVISDFEKILALYDCGLYLQARQAGEQFGPLQQWPTVEGQLIAARIAANLGAPKLGRVLHALTHRRHPDNWEARYYELYRILDRYGPLRAWRFFSKYGEPGDDVSAQLRADWYSIRARVLSQLRDFATAESLQARAEDLAPDRQWVWIERANLYEQQDRIEDALAAAEKALELNPHSRPAVQRAAHLLSSQGRDEDALTLMWNAAEQMESGYLWVQIGVLESELDRHEQAAASLQKALELLPLIEKDSAKWLYARLADEAYETGDRDKAIAYCHKVDTELYNGFADAIQSGKAYRRKILPVGFVRQQHLTCGPATLSAIGKYWGKDVDHLQVAERICYDGTPAHSERAWAEENGFIAREFTVTWDAVRELIDRNCPFTLTTVSTGSGHLQAAIGYDECRGSLTVRDPGGRNRAEFVFNALLEAHKVTGPRGMTMVPREEAALLEGIELPDAQLYDHYYSVQQALERHDRTSAWESLEALRCLAPQHRLTLQAGRAIASYDCDMPTQLAITEQLLEQFPEDVNLQVSRYLYMQVLSPRDSRLKLLEEKYSSSKTDPVFWRYWAQELSDDARQGATAHRLLERYLRYRRDDAAAYRALANIVWDRNRKQALWLYRWAACLDDKNEDYARAYCIACRNLRRANDGYRLLLDRFKRFCRRSPWPAQTLCWALSVQDREQEAFKVLEIALKERPQDGDLMIFAADLHFRLNRPERGMELLERAAPRVHRGVYLSTKARFVGSMGNLQEALALWREAAELDPLSSEAHAAIARLLHSCESVPAALAYLREVAHRFPFHMPIQRLRIEWLRSDEPVEAEAVLRDLLAAHPSDAWAQRELALTLCKQSRANEALAAAKAAYELDPINPQTYIIIARVHRHLGNRQEAVKACRKALKLSVDTIEAIDELMQLCLNDQEMRGELDFIRKQLTEQTTFGDGLLSFRDYAQRLWDGEKLLQVLREAHAARPDLRASWTALIGQLLDMDRVEEAHPLATAATDRFPLLPAVWWDLANVCAARKDDDGEERALEQALAIDPTLGNISRRLSDFYEKRRKLDRARAMLEQAVARSPDDCFNRGCLADFLWRFGERDQALEQLSRALRVSPGYEWGWEAIGGWYRELNREGEMLDLARVITSDRPGDARSWLILARVQQELQKPDEALVSLERAIALNPLLIDAHDQRAMLLCEQARFAEAIDSCSSPVWRGEVPLTLRGRRADILWQQNNRERAVVEMQNLLAENADYPWGWYRLAQWLEELNRKDEYVEACRQLARSSPRWFIAQGYLGDAEAQIGNVERAVVAFEEAFRLEPTYTFAGHRLIDLLASTNPDRVRQVLETMRQTTPSPAIPYREVTLGSQWKDVDLVTRAFRELCSMPDDEGYLAMAAADLSKLKRSKHVVAILEEHLLDRKCNPNLGAAWMRFHKGDAARFRFLARRDLPEEPWNRACVAWLEDLSTQVQWRVLRKLVRRYKNRLAANRDLWANTGRALQASSRFRKCVSWMKDRKWSDGVEPWMMANLAMAHWHLNNIDQAMPVSAFALQLPPDRTTHIHRILLAAGHAIQENPSAGATLINDVIWSELEPYYAAAGRLVNAAIQELLRPDDALNSAWSARRQLLAALGDARQLLKTDTMFFTLYRRLMIRIAAQRGNLPLRYWYTLWRIPLG